jgi:hypothetical protein
MIHTDEDDEFERLEREIERKKGQPYHFEKRMDDDDIQDYVRPWVGLTDQEIEDFVSALWPVGAGAGKLLRAIEAKLKEKNHG